MRLVATKEDNKEEKPRASTRELRIKNLKVYKMFSYRCKTFYDPLNNRSYVGQEATDLLDTLKEINRS